MTDTSHPLAEGIARGIVDGQHAAHAATKDLRHDERKEWLEYLEREGVDAVQQILGERLDCANLPPEVAALVGRVCKPEHPAEVGAIAGILIGIGYILGAAVLAGPASALAIESMKKAGHYAIDPNLLADAHRRNRIPGQTARDTMADSGARGQVADMMFNAAYQSLAPGEWLAFLRRFPQLENLADDGLSHTGLDPEALNALKAMRLAPLDYGTAVSAVTQSQITMERFAYLLERNGIDPTEADVIFKTAGQSPPVELTLELWNRGLIDEPTVDKIVLESPIKNEYVPVIKLMRHRFPALEQTTTLMRRGIFTLEEGKDAIRKLGYTPELAEKMAEYASRAQSGAAKNLTVSQMTRLFEIGRWDEGKLTSRLTAAGFDADEAADIVALTVELKGHAAVERAATSIGTRYVSWKIDRPEAVTLLDRINVPATYRDELLEVWDARRDAQTLHLSEPFLHKAYKLGTITREEVLPRLLAMGYEATDAALVMATDFAPVATKPKTRDLTRADEVKRYSTGIIDRATLHGRLTNMGYDAGEADQIIELADQKLAEAAAKEPASNGA